MWSRDYHRRMSPRTPPAVVAMVAMVVAVVLLLAIAASSQPVQLWVVPTAGTGSPSLDGASPDSVVSTRQEPEAKRELGRGFGPLLQVLAVVVAVAGVAALVAMRGWWPNDWPLGGARSRRSRRFGSLPEVLEGNPGVNLEEARSALSTGQPGNAIVACWMRLESDIAAAGWPRSGAETSAEYVERIIADASVDPFAISDLAALFREARFSDHTLNDADRASAFDALSRVEAGLRSGEKVPT